MKTLEQRLIDLQIDTIKRVDSSWNLHGPYTSYLEGETIIKAVENAEQQLNKVKKINLYRETVNALVLSLDVMYDIRIKQPIENFPDKLGEAMQQCQAVLAIMGEKYESTNLSEM